MRDISYVYTFFNIYLILGHKKGELAPASSAMPDNQETTA
jgi:hypothetical protein